jgi:hypothetical protein
VGQERECRLRYGGRCVAGKAYLETDYLLFRGEQRLKIPLKELQGVRAAGGVLTLEFAGGPAELELGEAAGKWAGKILHPPSRADKLGVKPGVRVLLEGAFEAGFEGELNGRGASVEAQTGSADLIFFAAETRAELAGIANLARRMKPDGAVWVVYPKGVPAIREMEVLEAGRAAGLKDTKVASFSATHTALRFVIPLSKK